MLLRKSSKQLTRIKCITPSFKGIQVEVKVSEADQLFRLFCLSNVNKVKVSKADQPFSHIRNVKVKFSKADQHFRHFRLSKVKVSKADQLFSLFCLSTLINT